MPDLSLLALQIVQGTDPEATQGDEVSDLVEETDYFLRGALEGDGEATELFINKMQKRGCVMPVSDVGRWEQAALDAVVELMAPLIGTEKARKVLREDGSVEGAANLALYARGLEEHGVAVLLKTPISILTACREILRDGKGKGG